MRSTILVVDCERGTREALARGLESEDFTVLQAADGKAALDIFRTQSPDLIVLEVALPELGGLDVCRIVRSESDVPILFLTSKATEIDKILGLELGADDYVTKPFSFREVLARIRALFRRSEARARAQAAYAPVDRRDTRQGMVKLGRVWLDLPGHRLIRDGESLPVKPKAFQLLAFLLRNAGQVFTREQLVERVWGYDYAGETRTVNVHICWLRTQIEDEPAEPRLLQTVRGVGYVLRTDGAEAPDADDAVVAFRPRIRTVESTPIVVTSPSRDAARAAVGPL